MIRLPENISIHTTRIEDPDPTKWLGRSIKFIQGGKLNAALSDLDKAEKYGENNDEVMRRVDIYRCLCFYRKNQYSEARRSVSRKNKDFIEPFLLNEPFFLLEFLRLDFQFWEDNIQPSIRYYIQKNDFDKIKYFINYINPLQLNAYKTGDFVGYLVKNAKFNPKNAEAILFEQLIQGGFNLKKYRYNIKYDNYELEASVLFGALEEKNMSMFQYLIKDCMLSIDEKNKAEEALLHRAASLGEEDFIDYLLSLGMDINIRDGAGKTPLMDAVEENKQKAVSKLLAYGAQVNLTDHSGKTALIFAVDQPADFFYMIMNYNIPAVRESIIKKLICHGANFDICDKMGNDALYYAYANRDSCIFSILCDYGARANRKYIGLNNRTILQDLCRNKFWKDINKDFLVKILKQKYDLGINLQDDDGYTALMYSLEHHWYFFDEKWLAKRLIEKGADKNLRSKKGETAMDIAKRNRTNIVL